MGQNMMAERRRSPRFPLILSAEIKDVASGTKLMARTSDVSRTGCYLDTLRPSGEGALIQLRLTRGAETFQTQALVVNVSPGRGMGIRFDEFVKDSQQLILDRWLSESETHA